MGYVAPTKWFGRDVRAVIGDVPAAPRFHDDLRTVMVPRPAVAYRFLVGNMGICDIQGLYRDYILSLPC